MNQSSSSVIIGILVVVVIAIVGWLAYSQGFFDAKEQQEEEKGGLEINIGGTNSDSDPASNN